jgi:hypothetical protein
MSFLSSAGGASSDDKLAAQPHVGIEPAALAALIDAPAPVGQAVPPIDEAAAGIALGESDLRLFAGANAEIFVRAAQARREKRLGGNPVCWPGFLVPAAWFLYRKMYGCAAIVVLPPVFASLVHVPGAVLLAIVLGCSILGAFGKPMYLARARRMIAEIRAAEPDEAIAQATIARAGGASLAGAVIGVLLIAAFVAVAFLKI